MSDLSDLIPGTFKVASVRMTLDGYPTVRMEDGREVKLYDASDLGNILILIGNVEAQRALAESIVRFQQREASGENAAARAMVARVMAQADRVDVQDFIRRMGPMTPLEFIAQEVVAPVYNATTGALTRWKNATHWTWTRLQSLAGQAAETGKTVGKVVLVGGLVVTAGWLIYRATKKKKKRRS